MVACLLHVRSRIAHGHVENSLDELEQRFLPDTHYVLSRQGTTSNYVFVPDRDLAAMHQFLTKAAENLLLDQLSLVSLGREWAVREQGCSPNPTEDACGEWVHRRDPDTMLTEEVRIRTGLVNWLRKHGNRGVDMKGRPVGVLLYMHQPIADDSGWLYNLRDVLGPTARAHMKGGNAVLITAQGGAELSPRQLFKAKRFKRYIWAPQVHTALAFTLGREEAHTAGLLQSVVPPVLEPLAPRQSTQPFRPQLIVGGAERAEAERRNAAFASLKRAAHDRRKG